MPKQMYMHLNTQEMTRTSFQEIPCVALPTAKPEKHRKEICQYSLS